MRFMRNGESSSDFQMTLSQCRVSGRPLKKTRGIRGGRMPEGESGRKMSDAFLT